MLKFWKFHIPQSSEPSISYPSLDQQLLLQAFEQGVAEAIQIMNRSKDHFESFMVAKSRFIDEVEFIQDVDRSNGHSHLSRNHEFGIIITSSPSGQNDANEELYEIRGYVITRQDQETVYRFNQLYHLNRHGVVLTSQVMPVLQ